MDTSQTATIDATETPTTTETVEARSASEAAIAAGSVADYRAARRAEREGKPLPTVPVLPDSPDSAQTDAAAPAQAERQVSKRQQQINDYERRIAEQHERIARLEAQIGAPRQPEPTAARSEPADDFPDYADWLDQPDHAGKPYEAYVRALARHEYGRVEREKAVSETRAARERDAVQVTTEYKARVDAFVAKTPDFVEKVTALDKVPDSPAARALTEAMQRSEHGPALAYHLATTDADLSRLLGLAPIAAVHELGKLETKLTQAPPAKPITSAPMPPMTLGSKAADPGDELEAAVASGDVARFKELRRRNRAGQFAR